MRFLIISDTVSYKGKPYDVLNNEKESNNSDSYILGERSNRYIESDIDWETYPSGIVLALRGTKEHYDDITNHKCGSIKAYFVNEDNKEDIKPYLNRCSQLSCYEDGAYIAYKRAKNVALRVLGYTRTVDWNSIKFGSANLDTNLPKFKFKKNEDFSSWLKRSRKITADDLKKAGLKAFCLIFHADRLKQQYNKNGKPILDNEGNPKEKRVFDPHFHFIGCGYLDKSNEFYERFGYTYTTQKSASIYSKKDIQSLANRIGYRLNHSAYYKYDNGCASHSVVYYGEMGYNQLKTFVNNEGKKADLKYTEYITDDDGNKYVAVRIDKKYIKSDKPKSIQNKLKSIENEIKNYSGYLPLELEKRYNQYKDLIYENNLQIDSAWTKEKIEYYLSPHTKEKIYLVRVERLKRFVNANTGKVADVSTFEFKEGLIPHFEHLDDFCSFKNKNRKEIEKSVNQESIDNVHKRFEQLKKLRIENSQNQISNLT
jgi:hypothetical protein